MTSQCRRPPARRSGRRRGPPGGGPVGCGPLGGASVAYWRAIAERHRLDLEVVNDRVDPRFGFMPLDWDGKIRRPRQRRPDWLAEGHHPGRLVRGPSVRHEDVYKLYAESFLGEDHLERIIDEARQIIPTAMEAAGA